MRLSSKFGLSRKLRFIWAMRRFNWTVLLEGPYKVFAQILFWIMVFCLYIILKEYPSRLTGAALICNVLQQTLELAIPSYSQNLLVLPFFRRGRWRLGIVLYLAQVLALIFGLPYILNLVGLFFGTLLPAQDRVDWTKEHITFSVIAFTIVATVFKKTLDRLILDKEQKENELRHLKAQLNPHFLFNTLNNLYGLSVAESRKLPELMLKLSDLLRYSLYDTNQDYVPLQKELDYITNYVGLEQIRMSDKTQIILDIRGFTGELCIAPLLLIVFVENSFKHFSTARDRQGFVHIYITLSHGQLRLNIKNSLDPSFVRERNSGHKAGLGGRNGGLGLNNAQQRLNLIYRERHKLTITGKPGCFEVDLQINLNGL
jgi:two-component system sensor histidine kinase LytS